MIDARLGGMVGGEGHKGELRKRNISFMEIVLGNYYITIEKAGLPGEGRVFKDSNHTRIT